MKKIIKLLPTLLVVPMLASCGKVKEPEAPKFADLGTKVELTEFAEKITKALAEMPEMQEDYKVKSSLATFVDNNYEYTSVKRGDEIIEESSNSYVNTEEMKYDAENHLLGMKGSLDFVYSGKSKVDVDSSKGTSVLVDVIYADGEKDGEKGVIGYDNVNGVYDLEVKYTDDVDVNAAFNDAALGVLYSPIAPYLAGLVPSTIDEDELKKYEYYVNEKVFTTVYKSEDTKELKDGDDVYAEKKIVEESKYQVSLTQDNYFVLGYEVDDEIVTYKDNYSYYSSYYLKDDVIQDREVEVIDFKIEPLKKKMKAPDATKYIAMPKAED